MSCLSPDALSHFEQREQELLALNRQLDTKKAQALTEASVAVRNAHHSPFVTAPSAGVVATPAPRSQESEGDEQCAADALRRASPSKLHSEVMSTQSSEALHTTIRFQNARIIALQEELDRTIAELASRDIETQKLKHEVKRLSDENSHLHKASGPSEQLQERLKKQLSSAEARINDIERERAELLRVKDQFDLQVKKNEAEISTKDARINRLVEECEKYKGALKESNTQDKDRTASDRKEMDRLTSEVRKLERQRTELVNAFKKQMKLIEVLKRQRAHIEAARVLSFTEDEFIRILELGEKLGE